MINDDNESASRGFLIRFKIPQWYQKAILRVDGTYVQSVIGQNVQIGTKMYGITKCT